MRKRDINSPNRYDIIFNNEDEIYTFKTERGVLYQLLFKDSASLLAAHQGLFGFYEFSFEPVDNQIDTRVKFDEKIQNTIEYLLFQFFENADKVLYYVCDTSDNRQLARERLFKRWFAELQPSPINQLEVSLSEELKILILIHEAFPFQKQFEEALIESEMFYVSLK